MERLLSASHLSPEDYEIVSYFPRRHLLLPSRAYVTFIWYIIVCVSAAVLLQLTSVTRVCMYLLRPFSVLITPQALSSPGFISVDQ